MWPRYLIDHTFFRKRHWRLISKWTLGLLNALNHHLCESSLILKLFWNMWYPEISFSRILHMDQTSSTFCQEKKLWHCFITDFFHAILHYFYKGNFNMWVTSGSYVGHIWIAQWVKWIKRCDPLSILLFIYYTIHI